MSASRTAWKKEKVSPGWMRSPSSLAAASFRLWTLFSWYTMGKPVFQL